MVIIEYTPHVRSTRENYSTANTMPTAGSNTWYYLSSKGHRGPIDQHYAFARQ